MSNQNNWEPHVGQKLVALANVGRFVKGEIYTAAKVYQCKCGTFHVEIVEIPAKSPGSKNFCIDCQTVIETYTNQASMRSFRFAPYNPYSNSVQKELADKACEPVIEIDQPVKKIKELQTN